MGLRRGGVNGDATALPYFEIQRLIDGPSLTNDDPFRRGTDSSHLTERLDR